MVIKSDIKCRNIRGCLDQYMAPNSKYTGGAPPPTPWKWRRVPPSNTGECPHPLKCIIKLWWKKQTLLWKNPDNKVHGANMGPTWVLSAPDGPHVGPMNLVIRDWQIKESHYLNQSRLTIKILWHSLQGNVYFNTKISIPKLWLKITHLKSQPHLPKGQWVFILQMYKLCINHFIRLVLIYNSI